ncbi:carboxypeptidase-like regulatory domain-containing protein [Salinimicrobium oceani]|uniref:CarboxypepD_reg-like domain-containing protein n=1 Tax=Salinimicrobium oceani TaxID=2722702 RepID=A0ABX1CTU5_9FLAO|nr:carboxypeptidase-like regulatory domain-containing protein [Salinimicrobium oceani]NJW51711.1 hypothetical protein [Salinimicrobium oceani]
MRTKLEIKEPCNQDWNRMTGLKNGRFCEQCQKGVMDFSGYRRNEILSILVQEKKICGRFDKTQLQDACFDPSKQNLHLSKLVFMLGLGTILGFSAPASAGNNSAPIEHSGVSKWRSVFQKQPVTDSIKIEGTVFDTDELVLPGVNIHLKNTQIATQTDFHGNFSIIIPVAELAEENFLVFSYIGFETQEYRFYRKSRHLKIQMKLDTYIMGEVVIIRRQNLFSRIGNFFSKLFTGKKDSTTCQ